uniref:Uncharacterized protein n=1 Tax=Anas platyrhynchos platyrhynchos TaxID=8840 RepID=A0A493TKN7_ANAPP
VWTQGNVPDPSATTLGHPNGATKAPVQQGDRFGSSPRAEPCSVLLSPSTALYKACRQRAGCWGAALGAEPQPGRTRLSPAPSASPALIPFSSSSPAIKFFCSLPAYVVFSHLYEPCLSHPAWHCEQGVVSAPQPQCSERRRQLPGSRQACPAQAAGEDAAGDPTPEAARAPASLPAERSQQRVHLHGGAGGGGTERYRQPR